MTDDAMKRRESMRADLDLPNLEPGALAESARIYRVGIDFEVLAYSEAQARKRMENFLEFLHHLWWAEDFSPHEAVVYLNGAEARITGVEFQEDHEFWPATERDFDGDTAYLRQWMDPYSDLDVNPKRLALAARFGEDFDAE